MVNTKARSSITFVAAAALLALALPAPAQQYPSKPILVLMPLQAGSAVDVMIRIVAQKMSDDMRQQIVIENQPGAAGSIGAERVKRAAPDGYTVGALNDSILTMIPNIRQVAYDPVKDFAPVGVVAAITWVMVVNNDLPAKTVEELVALAKSRPGKLSYSSSGNGSPNHLGMELFKLTARIDMVHVPYKGAAPSRIDMLGGHIDLMFDVLRTALPYRQAGRMRLLAVASSQRSVLAPDLPTLAESGWPGIEVMSWHALLAPAGTPAAIVDQLQGEARRTLSMQREKVAKDGIDVVAGTPPELEAFLRGDIARWKKVIVEAKIRAD